jgi:LacI family transcriptional regulator
MGREGSLMRSPSAAGRPRKRVLLLLQYYDYRHHAGVAKYAARAGWALEDAYTQLRSLPEKWTGEGVISFHGPSRPFVDWLKQVDVPVVDMGEDQGISDFPRVMTDHAAIAELAVDHFAKRGYRNVGFAWAFDTVVKRRRAEAIAAAAGARRLAFHDVPLERLAELPRHGVCPIGLLTADDAIALRALRACEDARLRVPEQVAVMGVDNFEYRCDPASVPLTSIDPDQERVGYEAAAMLDRLMNGEELDERSVQVPPRGIVERDSTAMHAVNDVEVARALRYIVQHYRAPVGLRDVARATDISLRRLQTRFKDQIGKTILHEINDRRVKTAQEMLQRTRKKIRVVAAECGFGSSVKMIRVFQQYLGTSPKRYRQQVQQPERAEVGGGGGEA